MSLLVAAVDSYWVGWLAWRHGRSARREADNDNRRKEQNENDTVLTHSELRFLQTNVHERGKEGKKKSMQVDGSDAVCAAMTGGQMFSTRQQGKHDHHHHHH